jgi:autotransporter passenger strand-loop-strand repeat protein
VVGGGKTVIGDGKVEIAGSSSENVTFLASGSGILELDQDGKSYTGKITSFGKNDHQFLVFEGIGFAGATVTFTSAASHKLAATVDAAARLIDRRPRHWRPPGGRSEWTTKNEQPRLGTRSCCGSVYSGHSGAREVDGRGARSAMTTVASGQTLSVTSGQTSTGVIVDSGGTLDVLAGGKVISTVDSGSVNVSSGGTDIGTKILSLGLQEVEGKATGTKVFSGGGQNVELTGAAISAVVSSGGQQSVFSGGSAVGTTVTGVGATQFVYFSGKARGTTVTGAGAGQTVDDSGIAISTRLVSGGRQFVTNGGTAIATIDNTEQDLASSGVAISTTLHLKALQRVEFGGTALQTTLSGGFQLVQSGASLASGTTVLSGRAAGCAVHGRSAGDDGQERRTGNRRPRRDRERPDR